MSVLKIKNENNEWESVPVINGEDGFSPTITTSKVGRETTLTITDVNGTSTATILDGEGGTGSGDMTKATYDSNDNGIVDNAEMVNNHTVLSDVPANAVFTDTTYTAGTGIAINNGVISNTQTSAEWGNITGTLSDQTDLQNALNTKANSGDIPTKLSDLNNDAGFITNTVNNLTNYYTKSNTYTKTEVDNLIGAISSLKIQVVQSLPSTNIDTSTIYLVSKTGSTGDVYNEYIYVNNAWELIGSTEVDLTNYYTKTQTDTLLSGKQASLVSGTNIKTINNQSLLGSGNITIESGWGSITGTLSDQTDLYNELSNRVDKSADYGDDISGMFVNDSLNGIGLSVSDMEGRKYGSVNINTNGVKISGLIAPKSSKDAANKQYVDYVMPTKTSDLTNDSGFITSSVNNLTNYYTKTSIDSSLGSKQDSLVSGTNIKTINNESILGSGNITISAASVNDSYSTSTTEPYSSNYVNNNFSNKGSVLWTNSNPASSVAGGTTATLSSDDYDYIIWLYCYNTNPANTNIQKSSVCLKGKSAMMNIIGYATGALMRRVADYTNDTTYTFRDAYNASNVDNNYCIPLYAIGCKF